MQRTRRCIFNTSRYTELLKHLLWKTAWNLFKSWKILLLGVGESCSDIWSRSSSSLKTEALALQTGACNSLCTYGLLNYFYKSYSFTKLSDIAAEPYSEMLDYNGFFFEKFQQKCWSTTLFFIKEILFSFKIPWFTFHVLVFQSFVSIDL